MVDKAKNGVIGISAYGMFQVTVSVLQWALN